MTLPTGSQRNFMNLVLRDVDPALMTIDITANEKKQAEWRAEREKANPPKKLTLREELKTLQKQFFTLQQYVKGTEQTVINRVDNIRGLELRLTEVLSTKKHYEENCNLLAARGYERQACVLEDELSNARKQLLKEQRYSEGAARDLRTFNTAHGSRLKELQKEVG